MDGLLQFKCAALTLGLLVLATGTLQGVTGEPLAWSQLAELPDSAGTAGAFIAVIDDRLVVAGGSRTSAPLPQDGEAVVLDHAWVLETPSGTWRPTTPLPQPLAFGGAASFGDYAVFAGGTDGNNHHDSVWRIRFEGEDLVYEPLPALTQPCAYATAAVLNNVLYLAGGQNAPSSTSALNSLVTFDPSEPIPVWKTAGSWSGPERILASLVAQDGTLYLLGGAALSTDTGSNPILHSLSDSHRYHPDQGWTRIADFPHQAFGAVAAPLGPSHVLVLGGDSSSTPGIDTSPGPTPLSFSSTVHSYHTITDTWVELEQIPSGLGMTSAVSWQETLTIPGGASNSGLSVATVLSGILSATGVQFRNAGLRHTDLLFLSPGHDGSLLRRQAVQY